MKTGLLSTEFWLSAAAVVLGFLASFNMLPTDGVIGQAVALLTAGLAALGYTYQRTKLKLEEAKKQE